MFPVPPTLYKIIKGKQPIKVLNERYAMTLKYIIFSIFKLVEHPMLYRFTPIKVIVNTVDVENTKIYVDVLFKDSLHQLPPESLIIKCELTYFEVKDTPEFKVLTVSPEFAALLRTSGMEIPELEF